GHDHGFRRLEGTPPDLTPEEQASLNTLQAEYDALQAKYEDADELPDEVDARLGELEEALEAFANRPDVFKPAEIVHAGAFVSIDGEGGLQRSEEHTSELQSRSDLVCRLLLEKKKKNTTRVTPKDSCDTPSYN